MEPPAPTPTPTRGRSRGRTAGRDHPDVSASRRQWGSSAPPTAAVVKHPATRSGFTVSPVLGVGLICYPVLRTTGLASLLVSRMVGYTDRKFYVECLLNIDPETMSMSFKDGQIRQITRKDMVRLLGVASGGVRIEICTGGRRRIRAGRIEKVQALLGMPVNKSTGISIDDLKKVLQIYDMERLDEEKKVAARVAYTLLACSTFLAPRQANPTIPEELFQVVLDHENLGKYDWAGYVLSHLEFAVHRLHASLTGQNEVFVLGACPLVAELFYLEWVDFGDAGLRTDIYPKIGVYTSDKAKELIKLVQEDGVNGVIMYKTKPMSAMDGEALRQHPLLETGGLGCGQTNSSNTLPAATSEVIHLVKGVVDRGVFSMIKNVVSGVAEKLGLHGVVTDNFLEEMFSGNESGRDDLVGNVVNALCTKGLDVAAGNSASQGADQSASNDGEDPTGEGAPRASAAAPSSEPGSTKSAGTLADDEIYEPMVPSSEEDSGEEGSGMPAASENERITPVLVAGCSMAPDVNKSVAEPVASRCGGIQDLAKRLHEDLCGARETAARIDQELDICGVISRMQANIADVIAGMEPNNGEEDVRSMVSPPTEVNGLLNLEEVASVVLQKPGETRRAARSATKFPDSLKYRRGCTNSRGEQVMAPEIGMSFYSVGDAYDFYNLYSWEEGFGIRYGRSRLNKDREKIMQDIVCARTGSPSGENSKSRRCECQAMIRLYATNANTWCITEKIMGHNHSMTAKYGERISWPSHKDIDENMRAFVRQVRGGIQDSEGNKHACPFGIPSVQDAARNLQVDGCGDVGGAAEAGGVSARLGKNTGLRTKMIAKRTPRKKVRFSERGASPYTTHKEDDCSENRSAGVAEGTGTVMGTLHETHSTFAVLRDVGNIGESVEPDVGVSRLLPIKRLRTKMKATRPPRKKVRFSERGPGTYGACDAGDCSDIDDMSEMSESASTLLALMVLVPSRNVDAASMPTVNRNVGSELVAAGENGLTTAGSKASENPGIVESTLQQRHSSPEAIDGETEVLQAGDADVPASPVMGLLQASIDTDGVSVQGFHSNQSDGGFVDAGLAIETFEFPESGVEQGGGADTMTPTYAGGSNAENSRGGSSVGGEGGSSSAAVPSVSFTGFSFKLQSKTEIGENFPATYGLRHEEPLASKVLNFARHMMRCTERELDRKWFKHRVPTPISLSGWDFKIEFGPNGKITFIRMSAVHRMVSCLEFQIYGYSEERWRHVFDPRFARHLMAVSPAHIDYAFMGTMMSFGSLGYKVERVKKLMIPLEFMESWCLYVVDANKKEMLVMDPTMTEEGSGGMSARHENNAKRILHGLVRCIHELIPDWDITASEWKFAYNGGMHVNCTPAQSGLYILHYIREYNGVYLRSVLSDERLEYIRREAAYQIVNLRGNSGDLPDFMIQIII